MATVTGLSRDRPLARVEASASRPSPQVMAAVARVSRRLRPRAVEIVTLGLLVGPMVLDPRLGYRRLFSLSAADAFYYQEVARNAALDGKVSFDGVHPTNGFHPPWQMMLIVLRRVLDLFGAGDIAALWGSTILQLALLGGATWLVASTIRLAHDGRLTTWFMAWPFGAYALATAPSWIWAGGLGDVRTRSRAPCPSTAPCGAT